MHAYCHRRRPAVTVRFMTFRSGRVGPPVDHLVATVVDGHINLYDPMTARVHVLNGTASDAWRLSDGEHTAEQIVAQLASCYGVEADDIRSAVLGTVGRFREEGLLCPGDGTA
jgi:hypothetical protein